VKWKGPVSQGLQGITSPFCPSSVPTPPERCWAQAPALGRCHPSSQSIHLSFQLFNEHKRIWTRFATSSEKQSQPSFGTTQRNETPDAACCRWLCFSRGVGLDDPQRSLPTPTILWFCDSVQMQQNHKHLQRVTGVSQRRGKILRSSKSGKWVQMHKEDTPRMRWSMNSSPVSYLMVLTLTLPIHMDKMSASTVWQSEASPRNLLSYTNSRQY